MTSFSYQASEYNKTETILTPPNVTALSGNSYQYVSKAGEKAKENNIKRKEENQEKTRH